MRLPSKIERAEFVIFDDSDNIVSSYNFSVTNLMHPWNYVFWDGRKQMSLGGINRRKKIVRGFDTELRFEWEDVRNQEDDIVNFLNDLLLTKNDGYSIRFNAEGDENYLFLVPEDAVYSREFLNQVTLRVRTTISFTISQLQEDITYQ